MKTLTFCALAILVASGCSTSKKFDFNTAYKFSYYDYSKQPASPGTLADNMVASTNSEILVIPSKRPDAGLETGQPQFKPDLKDLSRAELKQIRKELKQEIRSLDSEIKSLEQSKTLAPENERAKFESSIMDRQVQRDAAKALSGKIFIGVIIGLAGLVLLIINVTTWLGALAVVVGLAFIVWGLIEKGSF